MKPKSILLISFLIFLLSCSFLFTKKESRMFMSYDKEYYSFETFDLMIEAQVEILRKKGHEVYSIELVMEETSESFELKGVIIYYQEKKK